MGQKWLGCGVGVGSWLDRSRTALADGCIRRPRRGIWLACRVDGQRPGGAAGGLTMHTKSGHKGKISLHQAGLRPQRTANAQAASSRVDAPLQTAPRPGCARSPCSVPLRGGSCALASPLDARSLRAPPGQAPPPSPSPSVSPPLLAPFPPPRPEPTLPHPPLYIPPLLPPPFSITNTCFAFVHLPPHPPSVLTRRRPP